MIKEVEQKIVFWMGDITTGEIGKNPVDGALFGQLKGSFVDKYSRPFEIRIDDSPMKEHIGEFGIEETVINELKEPVGGFIVEHVFRIMSLDEFDVVHPNIYLQITHEEETFRLKWRFRGLYR
jgi:hypothetical protein